MANLRPAAGSAWRILRGCAYCRSQELVDVTGQVAALDQDADEPVDL